MQTFLPYADFAASAAVLDDRRLGKQRVETFQILRALTFPTYAWKNHPAVRMWRGFVPALVGYGLATCAAWRERGFADSVAASMLEFTGGVPPDLDRLAAAGQLPPWLGLELLHVSHRSALVRKEPEHYRPYFPDVPDDLPYLWPRAAFPRWPVRRPAGVPMGLDEALAALGFDAPRPGQAAAVAAIAAGRNVLLAMPAGYGGSATGLLAGLTAQGLTVWVTPAAGGGIADLVRPTEPLDVWPRLPRQPRPDATGARLTARPPGPADLAALAEEVAADPDFVFLRPAALAQTATVAHLGETGVGLVVVDDSAELSADAAASVAPAVRRLGVPPVLVVTGPTDSTRRSEIVRTLQLEDPVLAGGGFDRPSWLGVRLVGPGAAKARAVAELVRAAEGPGLVVAIGRPGAERLAAALNRSGLRAGVVAAGMRPNRRTVTLTAYRTGRLDVLVVDPEVTADLGTAFGRARVHFVHPAGPPADLDALHDALGLASRRGERSFAVVLLSFEELRELTGPQSPGREALGRYTAGEGCRRALLLDHYGEPVAVPCGRCDRCAPAHGPVGTVPS